MIPSSAAPRSDRITKPQQRAACIPCSCCRKSRSAASAARIAAIEQDPWFLRASRVVIPASINALQFYRELGYTFAPGGDQLDEEQLYCLEKFPQQR